MSAPPTYNWTSSGRTDTGSVRDSNEDAFLDRPDLGIWVVADGMGGHAAGALASQAVVEALASMPPPTSLSSSVDDMDLRLQQLNKQLRERAAREEVHAIGSTVVGLIVLGRHAVCLWAGDSRLYRCRAGQLEQLTQDHALVEELVEKGVLRAEEAARHPQSNLVTRAIGAGERLYLDLEIFELEGGERFILCSDGLDKEVAPADIAHLASTERIERLSDALVNLAVDRGARDNVTVVSVQIESNRAQSAGRRAPGHSLDIVVE